MKESMDRLGESRRTLQLMLDPKTVQEKNEDEASNKALALFQKDEAIRTDIIFMVMGEAQFFKKWYDLFANDVDRANSITFFYASFDKNLSDEGEASSTLCNHHGDRRDGNTIDGEDDDTKSDWCHSIFIPGTTWTEGRNLLAEEAIRMERKKGNQFTHWIFSDDDIFLSCGKAKENNHKLSWLKENGSRKEMYGVDIDDNTSCWQHVFDFIGSGKAPQKASNIYLTLFSPQYAQGFSALSTVDAIFNAFTREYVPYLLPYPTVPQGQSQWLSQGGIFCIIRSCMPSSSVTIPYVVIDIKNTFHSDYVRGFPVHVMNQMNIDNYANEEMNFKLCPDFPRTFYHQGADFIQADTMEELNEGIPKPKLRECAPLKTRFESWEASII
jgi:hypothetical protein